MAESDRDLLDQLGRILVQGKHRWLYPDEICELLRNHNRMTIAKEPTNMPPSGSILFFDKKVQRHFRKDGYKWKKAKDGKIVKEAHERLKVGGVDTLHCYYAHGEEDENFHRRSYWMLEENLSHMVLVHYREVKGDKETAEGVQRSRKTVEITLKSEIDSFAPSGFNPTYNHQASSGLPPLPELQHAVAEINAGFLDTSDSLTLTTCNAFDLESIWNDFTNLSDFDGGCNYWSFSSSVAVEPSNASHGKRQRDSTASEEGKSKATTHATTEKVDKEKDEQEEGNDINQVRKRTKVTCGQKSSSVAPSSDNEEATSLQQGLIVPLAVGTSPPQVQEFNSAIQQGEVIAGNNPAASDVAVTIDTAITEGVTNDATALSQASFNSLGYDFQSNIQDSQSIIKAQQDDEVISLAAYHIADPTGAATSAIWPHLNPYTIANVADQNVTQIPSLITVIVSNQGLNNQQADQNSQPPVSQPTATVGIAISATNKTAASESSNPTLVQSRPTSDANQDFGQDFESQEKETEPTPFEPENGKGKVVVQRDAGTEKAQEGDATAILAAFSITDPSGTASLAIEPIHLNPNAIANVVDQAQDLQPPVLQPTATTGVVISATTNETAASEYSNPALVQSEPTSNANQDFAQDIAESQEKETQSTTVEPENGKSKAVVQNDFGTGKSRKVSEVVVMSSHKRLHELLDRASAPNTLAGSSSSTSTIDSQTIATIRATLEMDFITMAGEVQRTRMISRIQSLVDSNFFPTVIRPMILGMLKQLERSVQAYSEAYSEYDDMGKNLTDQVEATKQLLQPQVQFCDSKRREFLELQKKKMKIEARQAAIVAEIHGAIKVSEPIQAQLEKLLLRQDQVKEKEGNLKTILDIGDDIWTTLKNTIHRHLPT